MSTLPAQHPAVVLRSSYRHLRALLVIAAIVIVGLTAAVVVLAVDHNGTSTSHSVPSTAPTAISQYPGRF